MRTFITSDLHFGHANIMKFCPATRGGFRDVVHMDEEMIRMWNEQVQPADRIYILGDVAFSDATKATGILTRLNGEKVLVKGNHDRRNLRDPVFCRCFLEIHDYLCITYDGTKVIMFHYPILEFDQQHRGAVHFYGHVHQTVMPEISKWRTLNVGFDSTGRIVLPMEEAIALALKGQIKSHH